MQDELLSIGKLSKLAKISTDTIRYYDDIGLFKPAYISDESGYRYYAAGQVEDLARIRELKLFGFSLNEIKNMSLGDMPETYEARYWTLLQEKGKLQNAIDKLSEKIKHQQEVFLMEKTVLLIDDSAFLRSICKEVLTKAGYDVVGEAADGLEGVEMYKKLQPDLVVLDIAMPEHDGKWALQRLIDYDAGANIIMLSALGQLRAVVDSLIWGARDFVVKPFQGDFLVDAARKLFQGEKQSFNMVMLNHLATATELSGERVLSQDVITKIVETAKTEKGNPLPHELVEALRFGGEEEGVNGEGIRPANDETNALLHRLIEGQERMVSLLESLAGGANPTHA